MNGEQGTVTLGLLAGAGILSPILTKVAITATDATTSSNPTDWITTLQQFGPFLPFALGCVVIIMRLWKKVETLEGKLSDAQELTITKVVPALNDTNNLLSKNTEELARATTVMSQILNRPEMDQDTWRRMINALERSEYGGPPTHPSVGR
jgi:hypothetical protein